MPKDFPRARRVADQIQRELPELIRLEVKDPRVGMLTITEVEVNRDMEHAKIFFTTLGEQRDRDGCLEGLQRASGFLRAQLAGRMQLRIVPKLSFVYDRSVENGVALSALIDAAVAEDTRNARESGAVDDATAEPDVSQSGASQADASQSAVSQPDPATPRDGV
jgi:ribosome-binding factor A